MNLRQWARRIAYRHVGGTGLVLIYHRVADLERDPQLLAVSPATFDAQMAVLAERFRVVPLSELVGSLRRKRVAARSVGVTFDDGYADNLLTAAPVLQAHCVPATVFVSSGYVDAGREFWWDEIERLVLSPGALPERIDLAAGAATFTADLSRTATYSAHDAEAHVGWDVTTTEPESGERQRLYADLCAFVRPLLVEAREQVLAQLREAAGASQQVRETHRPLTAAEVRHLDAMGLVEVGAHTRDHALLSALPIEAQHGQIERDRRELTSILGHAPALFSYPYGGLEAYSDASAGLVARTGYEGACANHAAVVKPWTDPYRIPRISVGDVDAESFSATLAGWFDDPR